MSRRARHAARQLYYQARSSIPVDVGALAHREGLTVIQQELDDTVSGLLVIKQGQAVIGVNRSQHANRQRFTIAHELGHYVLHRTTANLFIDTAHVFFRNQDSTDGTRLQEIEANAFASELLMPEAALKEHVERMQVAAFDDAALSDLAKTFGVSVQALTFRLAKLGLIVDGDV